MARRVSRETGQRLKTLGIGANKQTPAEEHAPLVSLSYKYLDLRSEKFCCFREATSYFTKLLEREVELCRWNAEDLQKRAGLDKTLRFHDFSFKNTTEPNFGLANEDQLVEKPWQFGITVNEYGRVHGFFIDSTFYIRWLDPDHLLDPKREK